MLKYFSYHSDIIFRFGVYDAKIGNIRQIAKFLKNNLIEYKTIIFNDEELTAHKSVSTSA